MIALDRGEYGEIYRRTFGKDFTRQACCEGFERWEKFWKSEMTKNRGTLTDAELYRRG
jgi:hypothetical protein